MVSSTGIRVMCHIRYFGERRKTSPLLIFCLISEWNIGIIVMTINNTIASEVPMREEYRQNTTIGWQKYRNVYPTPQVLLYLPGIIAYAAVMSILAGMSVGILAAIPTGLGLTALMLLVSKTVLALYKSIGRDYRRVNQGPLIGVFSVIGGIVGLALFFSAGTLPEGVTAIHMALTGAAIFAAYPVACLVADEMAVCMWQQRNG